MGTHFAFAPRFEDENDDYSIIMVKALADRLAEVQVSHVADQGRNGTLFYWVLDHITAFEALWHRISTKGGALNYVVCKHIKYSWVYTARMGPNRNGSTVL